MLNAASPLEKSMLSSALAGQSRLRPTNGRHRRNMVVGLMLTSLVDAFSILVIFLIMNHSSNQDVVNIGDNMKLPVAADSQVIQSGVSVRIEGHNKFFVEDKAVDMSDLAVHLRAMNESADIAKKEGLVIVADRNMDYEALSPVILAGSQAGFTKFKFAVVRK
jgi:biopolymer transport protein ExbD